MVGTLSLEEQADKDFSPATARRYLGASVPLCEEVPVRQRGGSIGRCSEFDRDFMPAKASVGKTWKRVDRAFHRGEELPAVSLYKVVGFYLVLDSHYCVCLWPVTTA